MEGMLWSYLGDNGKAIFQDMFSYYHISKHILLSLSEKTVYVNGMTYIYYYQQEPKQV